MSGVHTAMTNTRNTAIEALAERLPDKCTIRLKAGDVLRMLTPGGGGWGGTVPPGSPARGSPA